MKKSAAIRSSFNMGLEGLVVMRVWGTQFAEHFEGPFEVCLQYTVAVYERTV